MLKTSLAAATGFALLCACSSSPDRSATYLAKGPNYAVMIHLDATDGRQIQGSIMSREVQSDFTVAAVNRPIAGNVEGKAINFAILYPAGNDPSSVPVSGLMTADGMDLTFFAKGRTTQMTFRRGTAEEYQMAVNTMFKRVARYD
jgi:hypothetical protein